MKRREVLNFGLAGAMVAALGLPAQAQSKYPERPIRMVVPFAPGGVNDVIGRRWAQEMSKVLGQNVFVENRAGASGAIGSADVARAKPDGYTVMIGNTTTHIINPVAMTNPTYAALKDFVPLAIITLVPTGIAVHPSLPVKNVKQLIALAKANPGKLSYGSAGTGSITNLTGELFKKLGGGIDIMHIPYKGGGPALTDLIAGHIPMFMPAISPTPLSYHRAGRLRMLAVFSDKRLQAAPDIPTAVEAGMPGMVVQMMNAILTTAGTPRPVIDQLHQAMMKVMADPGFQEFLRSTGAEPVTDSSPEKAMQFLKDEIAKWTPIIRELGFKID